MAHPAHLYYNDGAAGSETETMTETGDESDTEAVRRAMMAVDSQLISDTMNMETFSGSKPQPATQPSTVTRAAAPEYTKDTIISVPKGGGFIPKQTDHGIISMPGDDNNGMYQDVLDSKYQNRQMPLHSASGKTLDVVVYCMDKTGLHLTVDDGQNAEAGELFELVMEEMNLPPEARDVFSLWLISDLLELQLKPNHVPFKLACYWEELLEKYTNAEEDHIERDEPVLMFQRNVYFTRAQERKISDPEILRLLYHEAKENVVDARYPIPSNDCDHLCGLQALLKHRSFIADEHNEEYYRDKTGDFLPAHFCKRKWLFPGRKVKDNPEQRITQFHRNAFRTYGKLDEQPARVAVYKAYLEFCWRLPYYGAAFFRGQVEHPGRKLTGGVDDPVYIAVNPDGVFVIDMDDVVFLLGLLYEEMTWEFAEPKQKDNRNCIPCLFLQFPEKNRGEKVTKVLQVFSREAVLMDALIETFVEWKIAKKRQSSGQDQVDGAVLDLDDDGDGIIKPEGETWKQFNRLCLATFNKKGQCVDAKMRKPKPKVDTKK